MNQPDQPNLAQSDAFQRLHELKSESKSDPTKQVAKEWFPEDDDEWYEPDYSRNERWN